MKRLTMAQKVLKFFEKHKWGRGRNYDSECDCYCLRGAALAVTVGSVAVKGYWNDVTSKGELAADQLALELGFKSNFERKPGSGLSSESMVTWNDAKGRSKVHIIARLKRAIAEQQKKTRKKAA